MSLKYRCQQLGEGVWNNIYARSFHRVDGDHNRLSGVNDLDEFQHFGWVQHIGHKIGCCPLVTGLGCGIAGMLLDCGLVSLNEHVRKVAPVTAPGFFTMSLPRGFLLRPPGTPATWLLTVVNIMPSINLGSDSNEA